MYRLATSWLYHTPPSYIESMVKEAAVAQIIFQIYLTYRSTRNRLHIRYSAVHLASFQWVTVFSILPWWQPPPLLLH